MRDNALRSSGDGPAALCGGGRPLGLTSEPSGGAHLAGGKHALKLMESKHSNEVCGGNSAV